MRGVHDPQRKEEVEEGVGENMAEKNRRRKGENNVKKSPNFQARGEGGRRGFAEGFEDR